MAGIDGLWDTSYMDNATTETALQRFIRLAIDQAPEAREYYDRAIQNASGSKGKPLYDISRGKSLNPSRKTLQLIAEAMDQPLELVSRAADGECVDPAPVEHLIEGRAVPSRRILLPSGTVPTGGSLSLSHTTIGDDDDDDMVEISVLDLSLSMGAGANIDDYIEEEKVKFSFHFIQSFTRTPPHRLKIAKGVGESMFPTLMHNDMVWIDTTQTDLNIQDRVWAISLFGAGAIKRLRRISGGQIEVMSDNPTVGNQIVDEDDLRIAGRVIRFMRDL